MNLIDEQKTSALAEGTMSGAMPTILDERWVELVRQVQTSSPIDPGELGWEPETIVQLREGVGYLPFMVPGSDELMAANVANLRKHQIVLWAKHGVMARSDQSVKRASDRIEYAETGARYEYLNLVNGEQAEGLSDDEMRTICRAFNVQQNIF